jgi:Kef-type K+ transport system membrane component KefB
VTVLLEIIALFALARLFGEIFERAKLPALAGEILAGVILGPLLLGFVLPSPPIELAANLGIFFIVYAAGMEMTFHGVKRAIKESGAAVAAGSFVLPFLLGFCIALEFGYELKGALFLGLALSLTALPVSVRILSDLNWLNTDVGQAIITAGLLCDIAGLVVLAIMTNWTSAMAGFDIYALAVVALKIVLFFLVLVTVERILSLREKAVARRIVGASEKLLSKGAVFSVPLITVFAFSAFAELLGLHFIVGTFFGSVIVAEHLFPKKDEAQLRHGISIISNGFLAPIFFAYLGLIAVTFELALVPVFFALLVAAVVGKVAGSYIGARAAGFTRWPASMIGVGMNGRGAMELVISLVGLQLGLISGGTFSILVVLGIVTTLMTSLILRQLARRPRDGLDFSPK